MFNKRITDIKTENYVWCQEYWFEIDLKYRACVTKALRTGDIKTILFILRIIDKKGRMLCTGADVFIPSMPH